MNKKINPVVFWLCFLAFIATLYFYSQWHNKRMENRILKNAAFSNGYFTRFENTKGSRLAIFHFYVNDTLRTSGIGSGAVTKVWTQIQGQYFPVIYNKQNPEECEILVFRWDFERYKLLYPDSIQWVQVLYDRAR